MDYDDEDVLGGKQYHKLAEWNNYVSTVQGITGTQRGRAAQIANKIYSCVGPSKKRVNNKSLIRRCLSKKSIKTRKSRKSKKARR